MIIPKRLFRRQLAGVSELQKSNSTEYVQDIPTIDASAFPLYKFAGGSFGNSSREHRELIREIEFLSISAQQMADENVRLARQCAILEESTVSIDEYRKLERRIWLEEQCNNESKLEISTLRSEIDHLRQDTTVSELESLVAELREQIVNVTTESFRSRQNAAHNNFILQENIVKLETEHFEMQERHEQDNEEIESEFRKRLTQVLADMEKECHINDQLQHQLILAERNYIQCEAGLSIVPDLQEEICALTLQKEEFCKAVEKAENEKQQLLLQVAQFNSQQLDHKDKNARLVSITHELDEIRKELNTLRYFASAEIEINFQLVEETITSFCSSIIKEEGVLQRNTISSACLVTTDENKLIELEVERSIRAELASELSLEKRHNFELQLAITNLERKIEAYDKLGLEHENEELHLKCDALEQMLFECQQQHLSDENQIQQFKRHTQRMELDQKE